MPPDTMPDPNNPVLSRDLYDQILHYSTVPVLLVLIWLSWFLINRLMSPARRLERRHREIRKAVAEREAWREAEKRKQEETDSPNAAK